MTLDEFEDKMIIAQHILMRKKENPWVGNSYAHGVCCSLHRSFHYNNIDHLFGDYFGKESDSDDNCGWWYGLRGEENILSRQLALLFFEEICKDNKYYEGFKS